MAAAGTTKETLLRSTSDTPRSAAVEAFERFVLAHEAEAFRTAYLLLRDTGEAEVVARTAFLRVFERRSDGEAMLRLALLAETVALSRAASSEAAGAAQARASDAPRMPRPEVATVAGEQNRLVLGALSALSFEDQVVIALAYFIDLTLFDLAVVLKLSPAAAQARLGDALERLVTALNTRVRGAREAP